MGGYRQKQGGIAPQIPLYMMRKTAEKNNLANFETFSIYQNINDRFLVTQMIGTGTLHTDKID